MLTASIFELNYCRLLTETLSAQDATVLTSQFDYTFAVCYGTCHAAGFETIQKTACLIDLGKGLDYAFAQFHATSRNEVRRALKMQQLTFETGILQDFSSYFEFYKTCENARNWIPIPETELRNSMVITACFEEKPISGMSAYTHEGRLRIGRIFSLKRQNDDPRLNNLVFGCAAKHIVYAYCRYASEHGYHTVDLGGIDLNDPAKAGITRFKLSLGGKVWPVTIARHSNDRFKTQAPLIRDAGYDIT